MREDGEKPYDDEDENEGQWDPKVWEEMKQEELIWKACRPCKEI